jgi:hypothetical protein
MMSIIEQVSADLPNFPDDIVKQWIGYYAESEGWPPPEPLEGRWKSLLANKNLEYLKTVEWNLEVFYPPSLELTQDCNILIQEMVGFFVHSRPCNYSDFMGDEARPKLARLLQYLREQGDLPCKPILIKHVDKYEILDGNHRFVAYLLWEHWKDTKLFQKEPFPVTVSKEIEFWVGSI